MSRSRPHWSRTGALTTTPIAIALPDGWTQLLIKVDVQTFAKVGKAYTPPAVTAVNGVTTIRATGAQTGGTVQILTVFGGQDYANPARTAAIPYNESAANIKTALIASVQSGNPTATWYATGDMTAAGGPVGTADVTLTWTGVYAGTVPKLNLDSSGLTGPGPNRVDLLTTTYAAGNGGYGYIEGGTQMVIDTDGEGFSDDRFLYLASVSGTGTFYVSAFR
jgi:hypothetical protein